MIKGLRGTTIWSEDLNNLLPFYRDVLGLPLGLQIPGFVVMGELGTPAVALGTHSEVRGRNADPARHMVGLGTDDVDADWKRLKAAGVEFVEDPTDYDALRIATLKDPEGNLLQLLQPLPVQEPPEQEIVITRVFDAPRALVYKAWTEPERVMRWWGPNGFTTPACTIDLRPGGVFHACMRSPEGQDFWSRGVYREIVEPERIVSTDTFADADGNVVEPTHYGMSASWPREALLTLTFAEHEGRTTLTLRHTVGSAPASERDMCQQGWGESLDRLAGYLAQDGLKERIPMGAKSEGLAKQFEAKAREAAAALATLSDADWKKVTAAETWTVGVTAHHLAGALEAVARIITAVVSGQSLGTFTGAMLDEMNATHAKEHANCTRADTIALLEKGAAAAAAVVRGLSDDHLVKSRTVFADAPPMTIEQLVVSGLITHIDEHVGSIRKTVGT